MKTVKFVLVNTDSLCVELFNTKKAFKAFCELHNLKHHKWMYQGVEHTDRFSLTENGDAPNEHEYSTWSFTENKEVQ